MTDTLNSAEGGAVVDENALSRLGKILGEISEYAKPLCGKVSIFG